MNAETIQATLRALADPKIAEHSQRYFKTGKGEYGEGDSFLGIRVPVVRQQVKRFKATPLNEISKLLQSHFHEERLCALLLLVHQFSRATDQQKSAIYKLYIKQVRFINNWDLVDTSAPFIMGEFLFNQDRSILFEWMRSRSLWKRRIAIMATFYFIRQHDFADTFLIAENLLSDKEDLIHKAVGWMLREVGNRDKKAEIQFLKKHYPAMPRTMLRYAIEKFPEAERKRYLNGIFN